MQVFKQILERKRNIHDTSVEIQEDLLHSASYKGSYLCLATGSKCLDGYQRSEDLVEFHTTQDISLNNKLFTFLQKQQSHTHTLVYMKYEKQTVLIVCWKAVFDVRGATNTM